MKHPIKKLLGILVILSLALATSTAAFAAGDRNGSQSAPAATAEEMKEYLIAKGYPADYVNGLADPQLEDLYGTAYGNNVYFGGLETVVLNSNDGNPLLRGSIPVSQLSFSVATTYITMPYNGANYITDVNVYVTYNWVELPVIWGIDSIAVNWNSNLLTYDGDFISYNLCRNAANSNWLTAFAWYAPAELRQGGLGTFAYLNRTSIPDNILVNGQRGSVSFYLIPTQTLGMKYSPTNSATTVSADYVHNKSPLGLSLSFTFPGTGLVSALAFLLIRSRRRKRYYTEHK
ncbi:MAG: hypothetical protein LBC78_04330 [Oscillospiraceae bacterium]|jgi:hypothetical protein|nr:hypothetical protein [Oscillospiraceae bacterium]